MTTGDLQLTVLGAQKAAFLLQRPTLAHPTQVLRSDETTARDRA
jgi:hypothetical protein